MILRKRTSYQSILIHKEIFFGESKIVVSSSLMFVVHKKTKCSFLEKIN